MNVRKRAVVVIMMSTDLLGKRSFLEAPAIPVTHRRQGFLNIFSFHAHIMEQKAMSALWPPGSVLLLLLHHIILRFVVCKGQCRKLPRVWLPMPVVNG